MKDRKRTEKKKKNPLLYEIEETAHDCYESLECLNFIQNGILYLEKGLYVKRQKKKEGTAYTLIEAASCQDAADALEETPVRSGAGTGNDDEISALKIKLKEAKDIIRDLLDIVYMEQCSITPKFADQAEDFVREEE